MTPWLLISGDFTRHGGMDRANLALADHLAADPDVELHLVAHRVDTEMLGPSHVQIHRVSRPGGSHVLGGPLLARSGRHHAGRIAREGGRVIVNGGNCVWGDVSWVHYVHAAYEPETRTSVTRRLKDRLGRRLNLRHERQTLGAVRLAICNSRRTQRDLVDRLGVPEARTRVIYYGIDADCFAQVGPDAARAARAALGWPSDRPQVLFVGALGDRRKGFDTLFDAWVTLCQDTRWDGHLVVVGAGAERPVWQRRLEQAELGSRATFLGCRTDVARIIAASDVMVHPARYEAYGLGVHEALCRGVPAMVSADAGVAERYPAQLDDLLLRNPDSADELAERLRAWRARRGAIRREMRSFAAALRGRGWPQMAADIVAAVRDCA